MKGLFSVLAAWLALSPFAWSGENVDKEIEDARRQVDEAARHLADLYKQHYAAGHGENRAMLGVLLNMESKQRGVALIGVTPGGGAEKAGLRAGDLIVRIGDRDLTKVDVPARELSGFMKDVEPGASVEIVYLRDGERMQTEITTHARSAHIVAMLNANMDDLDIDLSGIETELEALGHLPQVKEIRMRAGSAKHGLMTVDGDLAEYFDVSAGVIVIEPPATSELRAGDVLLKVGDTEIDGITQAATLLDGMQADAEVQVKRHGKRRTVVVKPDEFAALSDKTMKRVIRIKHPDHQPDEVVNVEIIDD